MPLLKQFSLKKGSNKDYRFGKGRSFIKKKSIAPKFKTDTVAGNLNKRLKKTRKPSRPKKNVSEAIKMLEQGKPIEIVLEHLL